MEYLYLGNSGLKVSRLCLGTMTFGREADEKTSHDILDIFSEAGGNFIDTADVYSNGFSEEIIGRWIKNKPRDKYIIATKVRFPLGDDPNDAGLSRKHILSSVENSLNRLNTGYLDLYQVHCWDPGTPLEETLKTLDGLIKKGKIRYIGVSNFTGWQLQKALDISEMLNLEKFVSLQPLYNLLDRSTEWELLPICHNEGLGVIPWSPLRGGWLSGKYKRGMQTPPDQSRVKMAEEYNWSESWSAYNTERTWRILDTLLDIAKDIGKSPAQVALNWLLNQPTVTAPIIGGRNVKQIKDNLGSIGWSLPSDLLSKLKKVSDVKLPYPYEFIKMVSGDR